jgi:hypothetical protein
MRRAAVPEEEKSQPISDFNFPDLGNFDDFDEDFEDAQAMPRQSAGREAVSLLDSEKQEYDRQCDEARKHRSRVFHNRATKIPGDNVKVAIFGAGHI